MVAQKHNFDPMQNPLRKLLRRSTPTLVAALVLSLLTSVLMLVPPLYMINVFDKVMTSQSFSTLIGISLAAAIGIVLMVVFDFLRSKIFLTLGEWVGKRLSDELMEATLGQSIRGKGNVSVTLRDISDIRQFVAGSSIATALEFIWSPIFIIVLFYLHFAFGVLVLCAAAVMFVLAVINELMIRKPTLEANQAAVTAYNDLGDALRNADVIEGMGLMQHILKRWQKLNDNTLRISRGVEGKASAIASLSKGIQMVEMMAVIGVGAVLVIYGETSAGAVFAAMIISGRALVPFASVIGSWRQWISIYTSCNRLIEVVDDQMTQKQRSTMPLPRPSGRINVENLVFVPPGAAKPVIRNISLQIRPGELVAVMGASAAGKSTLAKLLVGIWPPSSGAVRFDDHDVFLWDRADFGQYIGYLPQQVELFTGTIRENIARLSDAPAAKVIEAAKKAGIHRLIGNLPNGYDTDVGAFGMRLTGGQRQRIALARALFGQPAILVLDEPDASLDAEGQEALHLALEDAKKAGITIVVVSHRPGLLSIADRIVVMQDGAIQMMAKPSDIKVDEKGLVTLNRPTDRKNPQRIGGAA